MANNKNKTILVTGATGQQGGAAMRHLQQKGFSVRAVTRDPNQPEARGLVGHGTEVVRGDLEKPETFAPALEDIHGIFSVQGLEGGVESEIRQGMNLVDAASRSQVNQFVYSSVSGADKNTGIPHFDSKFKVEEHLRGTGLSFSVIRPVFFMENLLSMRESIEGGTLALPLSPDTRLQMIAVDDIGAFVAMAFESPGKWQGRTIDIAGDELSMMELAEAFSRVSGREVKYQQVPWDKFKEQAGDEYATMYRWFEDVGYHADITSLKQEYRGLTPFERWLQTNWRAAAAAAGQ